MNLKTGKTVWADASFAPPVAETANAAPRSRRTGAGETPRPAGARIAKSAGRCRSCPTDGR